MVHAEVVLQRDGGKGLCGFLYPDMLFGLNRLVQTVAPLAAFHDTASLFIDNLHLTVHHHIFIILVEHGISLEQLLQGVHALALYGIVVEEFIFLVELLLLIKVFLVFQGRQLRGDVGQHKELLVVHLCGQPFCTLVGKIHRVEFLIDNEIQRFDSFRHTAVVVLHVILLSLQHTSLDTFFREVFDEGLVLWKRLM